MQRVSLGNIATGPRATTAFTRLRIASEDAAAAAAVAAAVAAAKEE